MCIFELFNLFDNFLKEHIVFIKKFFTYNKERFKEEFERSTYEIKKLVNYMDTSEYKKLYCVILYYKHVSEVLSNYLTYREYKELKI